MLPFQGAFVGFHLTQGVALGKYIPGFQPAKDPDLQYFTDVNLTAIGHRPG